MIKQRTMGLAVAICAFGIITTPAFAEFVSHNKETHGKGEVVEFTMEAGGGTVSCHAFSESASSAEWTIENEGKAATKGPSVAIKVEKWGECDAKSGELKETKAEIKGCEVEAKDPGEETRAIGKILTTCTIKVATCEIVAEPKENEKLTGTYLYTGGEENLVLQPSIAGVTTTTKGTCPGIKSSKEGKILGLAQMIRVSPFVVLEYAISVSKIFYTASNNTGTATITRRGSVTRPNGVFRTEFTTPKHFALQEPGFEECQITKVYVTLGESCSFNITYIEPPGSMIIAVYGRNQFPSAIEVSGS